MTLRVLTSFTILISSIFVGCVETMSEADRARSAFDDYQKHLEGSRPINSSCPPGWRCCPISINIVRRIWLPAAECSGLGLKGENGCYRYLRIAPARGSAAEDIWEAENHKRSDLTIDGSSQKKTN